MSNPPNYENWYPDNKDHETQERSYWRRQSRIAGINLSFGVLTFLIAIGAATIAWLAFKETQRQAKWACPGFVDG